MLPHIPFGLYPWRLALPTVTLAGHGSWCLRSKLSNLESAPERSIKSCDYCHVTLMFNAHARIVQPPVANDEKMSSSHSSASYPFFEDNFSFNITSTGTQPPQMSELELPELLKHPCVMDLFRQNQALQQAQIKLQNTHSTLTEDSIALRKRNDALQNHLLSVESELTVSKQKIHTLTTELHSLQVNTNM
jgi:hypothetical protein